MSITSTSFQLVELNVISAQDLASVSRPLRAYAVTWVHPDRKLSTRIDTHGHINPTWNDKFVFRVSDEFLYADTSAIMIEIYALHWFKDIHVGSVRVLVSNLVTLDNHQGMRFVALQVRRPSGRPQGILNIGMTVLDSSMRSMPLYKRNPSLVGYRHLMGEKDAYNDHNHIKMSPHQIFGGGNNNNNGNNNNRRKPLRRINSDSSASLSSSKANAKNQTMEIKIRKAKSALELESLSEAANSNSSSNYSINKSKASSMVNLVESTKKSVVVHTPSSRKGNNIKEEKKNDVVIFHNINRSDSLLSSSHGTLMNSEARERKLDVMDDEIQGVTTPRTNIVYEVKATVASSSPKLHFQNSKYNNNYNPTSASVGGRGSHSYKGTPTRRFKMNNNMSSNYEYTTPRRSNLGRMTVNMTDSELGPSPSEVAAAIANSKEREDCYSSEGGWSLDDDSVEGFQSKMDRWKRTEMPMVYEYEYDCPPVTTTPRSSHKANLLRPRRRAKSAGSGLFSCFSNMWGCHCSIVYGDAKKKATADTSRHRRSFSMGGNSSFA